MSEARDLRRFLWKAALLLPALLFVPVTNYLIDPSNLFQPVGVAERQMADSLLAGKTVVNFERYDVRLQQLDFLERMTLKLEIVVLGSSRPGSIGRAVFPGYAIVNATVLSAVLEDCVAMYHVVRSRGMRPKWIILGIDPWMLNPAATDPRLQGLTAEIDSGFADIGMREWRSAPYLESRPRLAALFSADYLQESLKSLRHKERRPDWYVSVNFLNEGYSKLPDGSYTVTDAERLMGEAEVAHRAQEYISVPEVIGFHGFDRISPQHRETIERMLRLMRHDGAIPVLYLPPYHPIVWNFLLANKQYQIVLDAEQTVRDLAGREKVSVIGSFNPFSLGLSGSDFYDGIHIKPEATIRLFSGLESPFRR